MENITLALALLLGFGFVVAKVGQFFKLPSVTGYICAGLILGPSGINFLSAESIGQQLGHFTQLALMMISFGIGEHLELKRLRTSARSVCFIGVLEVLGAFTAVCVGTFLVAKFSGIGLASWTTVDLAVLSILLGAISVATAPATTMHVMTELRASGPLTTTLMAVVAFDNGMAIMMFGLFSALAHQLTAVEGGSVFTAISASMLEIAGALLMGAVTGLLIDFVNNRLRSKNEMLTVGLALLLLCGEGARMLNLSPLLAGMAAGFAIVNRDHRDLRLFRALNAFEPPVYVLFFTLAGVHLDLSALAIAGWLGLGYFVFRFLGKTIGAGAGAKISSAPKVVCSYLGMALTPQAGVAIGLIFLLKDDVGLFSFSQVITPVVLTGVILSELTGPIFARYAVKKAGEAFDGPTESVRSQSLLRDVDGDGTKATTLDGVPMVPWLWERFQRPTRPDGVVVFGANHLATTAALARMAAIFAHDYGAFPLAARILLPGQTFSPEQKEVEISLTEVARAEVHSMGSELYTVTQKSENAAKGILQIAKDTNARAIVLGHSIRLTPNEFHRVLGAVVEEAPCPTIIIKFSGILHTERIIVPIVNMRELHLLRNPVRALATVGHHHISFLRLMPSYEKAETVIKAEKRLLRWAEMEGLAAISSCEAIATDARQETIIEKTQGHDLVIMAGPRLQKFRRLFFGSLAGGGSELSDHSDYRLSTWGRMSD
nr:cation:proton antiporter [Desulfobulbaceae bacterium]